ncbi:MAG: hypothetical protein ACK5TO_02445 [Planctomycetaceae bacterium]
MRDLYKTLGMGTVLFVLGLVIAVSWIGPAKGEICGSPTVVCTSNANGECTAPTPTGTVCKARGELHVRTNKHDVSLHPVAALSDFVPAVST